MKPAYPEFIRDVLITLHLNLCELNERKNFADPQEFDHIKARIAAYQENAFYPPRQRGRIWYPQRRNWIIRCFHWRESDVLFDWCLKKDVNLAQHPGGYDNVMWSTNTKGNAGAYAMLQDDGVLVIINKEEKIIWSSRN